MKVKKLLTIVLMMFVIVITSSAVEPIVKTIGDEEVEFLVPDDYDIFKAVYAAVVDMYVESENHCLNQQAIIDKYGGLTDKMSVDNENLQDSVTDYTTSVNDYIKYKNKLALYLGASADVSMEFGGGKNITMSPFIDFVKPGWIFGLFVPLTFSVSPNQGLDFSVGIGCRFGKRLNY